MIKLQRGVAALFEATTLTLVILTAPTVSAQSQGVPSDESKDYENPCGDGRYGGEFGLGFRGASVGISSCVEPNYDPRPACDPFAYGAAGAFFGMAYGQCQNPAETLPDHQTCVFIEILGHKFEHCF